MLPEPLPSPLRLNLGSGPCLLPGYANVDRCLGSEVYPLALPDECADEVRASHVLEHFSHRETLEVLAEWIRVLKPGGVLKIAVPDFDKVLAAYHEERAHPTEEPPPVEGWLMGGQTDENDFHHAIFTADALRMGLELLGLEQVEPWTSEVGDCASNPISLNLMGVKKAAAAAPEAVPAPVEEASRIAFAAGEVRAVISMPRLAFTDTMFCAMTAVATLGIGLERCSGAFWHQSMDNLLSAHLDDGTRFLVTMDYDSLFTPDDIAELLRLMHHRPEIDALCALQTRREGDSPLFNTGLAKGAGTTTVEIAVEDLAQPTLPIVTGHFGLTVLRVDPLRRLPRPWFHAEPDAEGKWGEGRMDSDIAFWHRFREAGLSLHLATRVVIGHLQMVATWPDRRMRPLFQYAGDYLKVGKPAGVWR